jgi:hypothetical protein
MYGSARRHEELGAEAVYGFDPDKKRRNERLAYCVGIGKAFVTVLCACLGFYFLNKAATSLKDILNNMDETDVTHDVTHDAFLIEHRLKNEFNLCEQSPEVSTGYALVNNNRSRYFYWFIPCEFTEAPLIVWLSSTGGSPTFSMLLENGPCE